MFTNKVVWITGASSGIGEALALEFAKQHATLILSSRRIDELKRVQTNCLPYTTAIEIMQIDLQELNSLQHASEQAIALFGRIDVLVNCGGISQRASALETSLDTEQKIMDVNFFSAVELSKYVLPGMKKNNYGKIILLSSIVGKFGSPHRSTYAASKHAIIGYFDSLRAELAIENTYNIHITIACPGFIHTDISYNAVLGDGSAQGILDTKQAQGMSAELCAQKIIKAAKKNKKEILIGRKEILMVYIRRFIPALYYKLITKVSTK